MSELARIRWRCRRGLMELEIVLERFLIAHYANLDEEGRANFDELLAYSDAELWQLVASDKNTCLDDNSPRSALVAQLREC
jgi:antitoxin CptB